MTPKFYGAIQNGKLTIYDEEGYSKYLSNLQGEVEIIVQRKKKKRSNRQNSYYWACIKMIADETGHTPIEIHNILKYEFLRDITIVNGKCYEFVESTTKLDTYGFSMDYMERIKHWAASELNINLPSPDEYYE